jgi:hypothetical protein
VSSIVAIQWDGAARLSAAKGHLTVIEYGAYI